MDKGCSEVHGSDPIPAERTQVSRRRAPAFSCHQRKHCLGNEGTIFPALLLREFSERSRIGCAVTDEESCLSYLKKDSFEPLLCMDLLEKGNGFEFARKAQELQPGLKVVVLALSDAIPVEYDNAP